MNYLFIPFACSLTGMIPFSSQAETASARPSIYGQKSPANQLSKLKRLPRLGMTVQELELLWGPGKQDDLRNYLPLSEPNKIGLRGKIFREGITCSWDKDPLKLVASFVNDKCVNLIVYLPKDTDKESAVKIMQTLMPNITFLEMDKLGKGRKLISKEKEGAYTFAVSPKFNTIYLEAPGLVELPKEETTPIRNFSDMMNRFIIRQEINAEKANRKDLLKKKRTGMTREEWEILMGPPTNEKTNWKSSKAIEWKDIQFSLRVTFEKGKCNQIILFQEYEFPPDDALEFMMKLMPGCRFEKKDIRNPNNVYVLSSVDARKRYKAVWTQHSSGKWQAFAMEIIDNFPGNS